MILRLFGRILIPTVLILISVKNVYADADNCNSRNINFSTPVGILPYGYKDLVKIPAGTTCSYNFSIPYGYVLELQTDYYIAQQDQIVVTNSLGSQIIYNDYGGLAESFYWCTAGTCQIQVESVAKASFMTYYWYRSLSAYTAISKNTGDYFKLSDIGSTQFLKFYGSQVIFTLAQNTNTDSIENLGNYYVYNGSDIKTSALIGTLDELKTKNLYCPFNFVSIVNFYVGYGSNAYIIANDASAISNNYSFVVTTPETMTSHGFSDYWPEEAAVTFACPECNQFYITRLMFDMVLSATGYVAFQGQTPSQGYLKRIMTWQVPQFSQNQLPQLIPTNKFTMYFYKANLTIQLYSGNNFDGWEKPFDGRKGLITSATVWDNLLDSGNFSYTFGMADQLFQFHLNMSNMDFGGAPTDRVNLLIGMTNGDSSVNYSYPGANATNITSTGNFMSISSNFSMFTKIVVPFEILGVTVTTTTTMEATITSTANPSTSTISTSAATTTATTSSPTVTTQSTSTSSTTIPTTTSGGGSWKFVICFVTEDYCPDGWNVLRKADDTPQTCDAMGGVKCQKPFSCVHSRCGMDFCCAHTYKIEQWKRQQEIEADIKEAELEDEEL
ncbi:hypothetical protein CRE_22297 [Caenorhabditis remanei]|uniref:CUB-like domain-containing protein n=1 Tax=Caenorhabditis remanei TaxID=31234 RepID=E3MDZ9_CAERE|nr:hypothetical protein CRE_22297 [Caenorhabditis remanei]